MAIINSRLSSFSHLVVQEKRKYISLNFPCKSLRNDPAWPRLHHTPLPDSFTVASGMKYFEFSACPFLGHTPMFGSQVCITWWVSEDMRVSGHGSPQGGDAEQKQVADVFQWSYLLSSFLSTDVLIIKYWRNRGEPDTEFHFLGSGQCSLSWITQFLLNWTVVSTCKKIP